MDPLRTQIGIIGAGPAGLMLAYLLRAQGIDSIVLESRSQDYVEGRIRAGVLEHGTVELLTALGMSSRMMKEGLVHSGIEIGFNRNRHRIDFEQLVGKSVTVYGQHEVIRDLIKGAPERGIPILFEVSEVAIDVESVSPQITFRHADNDHDLTCDFVAGCDGFHGISRPSIPAGILSTYDQMFPFSWLGILSDAKPAQGELVYMHSPFGFALFSMRSPSITRLYLQCRNDEAIGEWSDDRIWNELLRRFACSDGWAPNQGTILQKSVTGMRSFVTEPMQYKRLFLAGDAAHIVPPTGAKGMNLAIADVKVLAEGFVAFYGGGKGTALLDRYSTTCLRRIWKAQRFSAQMTNMLHLNPDASPFDHKRQLAELDHVTSSRAAATALAESYVGLPFENSPM